MGIKPSNLVSFNQQEDEWAREKKKWRGEREIKEQREGKGGTHSITKRIKR
jgi:hypothetical protein